MPPTSLHLVSTIKNDLQFFHRNNRSCILSKNLLVDTPVIFEDENSSSTPKFHFFKDGLDGTMKIEGKLTSFLCGTFIRTPSGDVPVETLRIGDLITTPDSKSIKIKWIGRRKYSPPIPDNNDIIPILIKTDAFSPNVPDRDLSISPHHGIIVDTYIVPAGALINDLTIYQNTDIININYYHIHTEKHEIIIANNTPVETFVDVDNLRMFDNAEEFYSLYPESSMISEFFALPRLEFGAELERLRQKIFLRTGLIQTKWTHIDVVGYLDYADRTEVVGWVYSPQKQHEPLKVELLNNESILARGVANIYRPDVKRAGFGSGRCGFNFILPAPLPAMKRHSLSIRVIGRTESLPGSPVILDPGLAADLLRTGELDRILEYAVRGASSKKEIEKITEALLKTANNLNVLGDRIATSKPRAHSQCQDKKSVVLFLDSHWPTADEDAGSNAILSHIRAFKDLGYKIEFCATSGLPKSAGEYRGLSDLEKMGVTCLNKIGRLPETIIRDAGRHEIKIVYLHKLATASNYLGLVRHHMPKVKIIYSVADLHHVRLARQANIQKSPELTLRSKSVRAAELCYMQMADCIFTHSNAEFDYIRRILPQVNVYIVRWGTMRSQNSWSHLDDKNIGFLGSAHHEPNFDAVIHLNDKILPAVWHTCPEVKCFIAGSDWPINLVGRLDSRIEILGHLPILNDFFKSIHLTVAPLRFGAGIKGKVIESMAQQRPCVMSPIAAEGLSLDKTLSNLVGPDDHQVAMILKLLSDPKFNFLASKAGFKLIDTEFSQQAVTAAIDNALIGRTAARQARLPVYQEISYKDAFAIHA